MIKNKINKDIFLLAVFVLSVFYMKQINFFFYNSTDSPDFSRYFQYIDYFSNIATITGSEQGLFYYYLHYINLYFSISNNSDLSSTILLHQSIQNVNFYIFIFGLLGYYLVLQFFKFSNSTVFSVLIFLTFLPISISSLLVFKPEILATAIFPWLIYCLEKFLKDGKLIYLICFIPLLVITISLKGSIMIITTFLLTLFYLKKVFLKNKKFLIYGIFLFLLTFAFVTVENNSANERNLFSLVSGSEREIKYDNKASFKFIYNINFYQLSSSPIKHNHADSLIAITLLDSFGDYFDLYWDNDSSIYSKNRRDVIQFQATEKIKSPDFSWNEKNITFYIQNLTDIYPRKFISLCLSLIFYYLLLKKVFRRNDTSKFLYFGFIALLLIIIHVITGFPSNNFDPNVGDTLKPIYYSFALVLSLSFLVSQIFENNKKSKFLLIPYIFLIFFLIGFPKSIDQDIKNQIGVLSKYSSSCEINKILFNKYFEINHSCQLSSSDLLSEFDDFENLQFEDFKFKYINLLLLLLSISVSIFLLLNKKFNP